MTCNGGGSSLVSRFSNADAKNNSARFANSRPESVFGNESGSGGTTYSLNLWVR
jgi:hypothetical protein